MNDLDGADQTFFTKISIAGKNTSVLSYRFQLTDLEVFDASTYKTDSLSCSFNFSLLNMLLCCHLCDQRKSY